MSCFNGSFPCTHLRKLRCTDYLCNIITYSIVHLFAPLFKHLIQFLQHINVKYDRIVSGSGLFCVWQKFELIWAI